MQFVQVGTVSLLHLVNTEASLNELFFTFLSGKHQRDNSRPYGNVTFMPDMNTELPWTSQQVLFMLIAQLGILYFSGENPITPMTREELHRVFN